MALGLSSINPQDAQSAKSSGIFTGIWGLVSPLIALFVGGIVAGRGAGAQTKASGGIHGLVVWGVTTLVGLWMVGGAISSVASGMFAVGKGAVQATGMTAAAGASQAGNLGQAARSFGLDANDALKPINERLASEGKPAITATQLENATKDAVRTSIQQGRVDRNSLIQAVASNTALSRADAEQVAQRIETQFNAFQDKAAQAAQTVQTGALKAADATGKVFWGVFGALFLGLISAIMGGSVGVSRRQQLATEGAVLMPTDTSLPTTRREVYP